jgi:WD40 repeat protein
LTAVDAEHQQAVVLDLVRSIEIARLGPHRRFNHCPISPDGRWVATATWKGKDVKVWEVATGLLAWQLPCDSAYVNFSPDGRWLVVSKFPGQESRLWHVGSWQPGPTIQVSASFLVTAFSRDGRLFAIDDGGRVRLVDPDSGQEIATLDTGSGSSTNFFCMTFSPDGTMLAAGRDHIVHLWDLRRIRQQLARLGLDWASPRYPPRTESLPLGPVELVPQTDDQAKTGPATQVSAGLHPPVNDTGTLTPDARKGPRLSPTERSGLSGPEAREVE